MEMSARGLAELAAHEAIVTRRYRDSAGVWTVGIGHTKAAGPPDPATITTDRPIEDWLALFREDVAGYAAAVSRAVEVPVAQHEFDALVSFHFNTGAIGRASLVKRLNAGASRASVAAGFMSWSKPPEIVGRRMKEMGLFRTGAYMTNPVASVYPASDSGAVLWKKGRRLALLPLLRDVPPLPRLPAGKETIRRGAKGPLVAEWQTAIGATADGDFGPKTEAATKLWQAARGLVNDGIVGPKSWAAVLDI